ncbi:Rieske (2Fe-2S) protein [Streptomyces sp. SID8352]|uniref:Rieske (2Fe-2S) protein n=1 Tax=Streptomyces sp. SID8352 TaxID=2690338 RepID=UPI001369AB2F|nr:Rieske (2Fe-2S) protein [Streptomyces sp. SID8352]MYU26214.1 Rieske 2Fe-2S domain-containing protein [Streptomyces sp. SID8352]
MARHVVGRVDDIPVGGRKIVELAGRSIGVFNVDGEFFALLNQCPHKGAELASTGTVFGVSHADTPSDQIAYEPRRSIRCPWHQWEYDIRTGVSFYDPENDRVRKYDVAVVAGAEVCESATADSPAYVLEGYAVEIDDDVIVVDTSRRRAGVGPAAAAS